MRAHVGRGAYQKVASLAAQLCLLYFTHFLGSDILSVLRLLCCFGLSYLA